MKNLSLGSKQGNRYKEEIIAIEWQNENILKEILWKNKKFIYFESIKFL